MTTDRVHCIFSTMNLLRNAQNQADAAAAYKFMLPGSQAMIERDGVKQKKKPTSGVDAVRK